MPHSGDQVYLKCPGGHFHSNHHIHKSSLILVASSPASLCSPFINSFTLLSEAYLEKQVHAPPQNPGTILCLGILPLKGVKLREKKQFAKVSHTAETLPFLSLPHFTSLTTGTLEIRPSVQMVQETLGNIALGCSQGCPLPFILILKSSYKSTNNARLPSKCQALLSAPRGKEKAEEDLYLSKLISQLSQEKQDLTPYPPW